MMTVTARSMAGTVKYLGWSPNTQLMRNITTKPIGMNMMTVTARSMAGTVKYLGWSPRSQHPEYLTNK